MTKKDTIEGFEGWDDAGAMEDLFQEATGQVDDNDVMGTVLKDDIEKPGADPVEGKDPVIGEEQDLFTAPTAEVGDSDEEGDQGDPGEGETGKKAKPAKISSVQLLTNLKERGLAEFELEEGEELDEELAEEILEDSYEQRMDKFLEEKLATLDPAVREIVKYNINGGNFRELLSKMVPSKGISITEDMDLANQENQIALVTRDRREKGESQEEIDTYVGYLKDSGKLEATSKRLHSTFIEKDSNLAKEEAERVALARREARERERSYRAELSGFIGKEKEFDGIKLTAKEVRELPAYIAEASVELEGGRRISPLHRDIFQAMKDKKKVVLLAKVIRDDFKFEQFGKAEKTRVVREIKDTLQGKGTTTNTKVKPRALADYFS